ncbi:dTDP-glucose 4,6-dehydratase [hydrothermal vent metagenome]|uniref:dTDP-glucose 4,6-dehydratase n=1 Tax=hydrothermal vent metagenome TaxID=652676 RepID=A0A3B1A570_9ZZZZ
MNQPKTFIVTGGAGFIGGNFVHHLLNNNYKVINLDALTYAGHIETLAKAKDNENHIFVEGRIGDSALLGNIFKEYRPDAIVNFAAESHVDRSIDAPAEFVQTNVVETLSLLESARKGIKNYSAEAQQGFRFLHVSTDEVYGSLGETGLFTEETSYAPNSPYAASKASSDHLVRSYLHTYGLPVLITNCSNNYGPYQLPEKLIPLIILNALEGKPLPVYGNGLNVRDWLYVEDHCSAILTVLEKGKVGEKYNIGGNYEKTNIEIVKIICRLLDEVRPQVSKEPYENLITYVDDRPGHDLRYAIDSTKIKNELAWSPNETFETGIRKTVQWHLDNLEWSNQVTNKNYNHAFLGMTS